MSSDEDEGPPPSVETLARRAPLPPIAELTPFQIQALAQSRARLQAVALKSIDSINQIYAEEKDAENKFQQAVLGMSAEQ